MRKIPLVDIRESGLVQLVEQYNQEAKNLISSSKKTLGLASEVLSAAIMPLGDKMAKNWLVKSGNPYCHEVEAMHKILGVSGVYALNIAYEWGCTAGVFRTANGLPRLVRALDWPFPGLGENTVVAHQKSNGGEFFNVTWPAVTGIFQAVAPRRFAAALNQAPMRRNNMGVLAGWASNRIRMFRQKALPPAHLLRMAFEQARTYDEAKEMLAKTPICLPVLYTLSGTKEGEGCVIERIENDFAIRELGNNENVVVSNHFLSNFNGTGSGWLPRALDSKGRVECLFSTSSADVENSSWLKFPVLNKYTRLAFSADAETGNFSAVGTYGSEMVTEVFEVRY